MARSKANKGISRIDSGSTHGWFVRGYRNGKTYAKLFSDRKNGGKGNAQKLAKEYRDALITELEAIPKKPRHRRIVTSDSRNTTGELGVSRTTKTGPNGTKHDCYSVSWRPEPGVQKCTVSLLLYRAMALLMLLTVRLVLYVVLLLLYLAMVFLMLLMVRSVS